MKGAHLKKEHEAIVERAESGLMTFCSLVLALIVVVWLCNDTLEQSNRALHHEEPVNVLKWLGVI